MAAKKMGKRKTLRKAKRPARSPSGAISRRSHNRVIVKFRDDVDLPWVDRLEKRREIHEDKVWRQIDSHHHRITLNRLFHSTTRRRIEKVVARARARAEALERDYRPPDFFKYFALDNSGTVNRAALVEELSHWDKVEWAAPAPAPAPPPTITTPDLTADQGYLNPAKAGIDARQAWTVNGGTGRHTRLVDIESGWAEHEDLPVGPIVTAASVTGVNKGYFGHGTSVLGILAAMAGNGYGCDGIAHDIEKVGLVSRWRTDDEVNDADAIMDTISYEVRGKRALRDGDVLLLEVQANLPDRSEMPVEASKEVFDAIRLATEAGIVVVEAAGNGANDLDIAGLPGDSGAILVGGGSSSNRQPKHTNRGSRIDCFAWSTDVTTTGDGDQGQLPDSYTHDFGGTSAASAIVAGAAVLVQSIAFATHGSMYSPQEVRKILGHPDHGTPSLNGKNVDRIGVMPDLATIVPFVLANAPAPVP